MNSPARTLPGTPTVYIVDDEESVRDSLAWLLRSRRRLSEGYASVEAFEAMLREQRHAWPSSASCLVLDVRMPGDTGTALFGRLAERGLLAVLPVMYLTGHGDVHSAVAAMQRGAFDYLEKPFADNALIDRIEAALAASAEAIEKRDALQRLRLRIARLSPRELAVMEGVVQGRSNQELADALGVGLRTVEEARSRLFEKMDVHSAVELANLIYIEG